MSKPTRQQLANAFAHANAALTREGGRLNDDDKAIQQAVISGQLSFEEAIDAIINDARRAPMTY